MKKAFLIQGLYSFLAFPICERAYATCVGTPTQEECETTARPDAKDTPPYVDCQWVTGPQDLVDCVWDGGSCKGSCEDGSH
jgi:hypothetical protein